MSIESLPVIQPQPNNARYGLSALELFTRYQRDTYFKAFGVHAPPYDSKRRIKEWLDTSVPDTDDSIVTYNVITIDKSAQTAVERTISMFPSEARTVNLQGIEAYPPYVIQPSFGAFLVDQIGRHMVNPVILSTAAEAQLIAQEIVAQASGGSGTAGIALDNPGGGRSYFYEPEELRRVWIITGLGQGENAGELLREKNNFGVGNPGHWIIPQQGAPPRWQDDAESPGQPPNDPRPPREVPVRPLLANERIVPWGPGLGFAVERTDFGGGVTPAPVSGDLAAAIAKLTAVLVAQGDLLVKMAKILGV